MMAEFVKSGLPDFVGWQTETPSRAYTRLVDNPSANAESNNGCHVRRLYYESNGIEYTATSYEPFHLRTYTAELADQGGGLVRKKVVYPKILFVHGLSSSGLFFDEQARAMAKLGIRSKAINLPPLPDLKTDPEKLWEWQVKAIINLFDSMSEDGNDVVLIGHSRGAQLSTYAAKEILLRDGEDGRLGGLMLQGPAITEAMRVKSISSGLVKAAFVGFNAIANHPERGSKLILDVGRVALSRPIQTITEAKQALSVSIEEILIEELKDIPIDIEYALGDEFTEDMFTFVKRLLERASSQQDRKGTLTVIDRASTNHMLSAPADVRGQAISLADPRMSSGHILGFLQAATGFYSPNVISRGANGLYETSRDMVDIAA